MVPTFRETRLTIELAPELRAAVKAEAERLSQARYRKVTMSDVVREVLAQTLVKKVGVK